VNAPQTLRTARRRFAVGLVVAAFCFGIVAAAERFAGLVDHFGAPTDDPTIDLTLGLQVLMAIILAGAAVVIGLRELRTR
jgi:F0F1-type ATP synthase membrane subunit a